MAQAPLTEEETAAAEEEPLDLGRLEVIGEDFTFEQELQLRVVRQALKTRRSEEKEDRDVWVCWYGMATASRFTYLKCARNGDLWALRREVQDNIAASNTRSGYGRIWVSNLPTNKLKFETALSHLPGSDEFDKEFIALAGTGARPPRDIPTDAELDSFSRAYIKVNDMPEDLAFDSEMIAVIEKEGLTVGRYNRIVDLITAYSSLMKEVADRVGSGADSSS